MWSSPASSPEAILTRTAVSMMYFLFTSVAARYNFWLPSASFTTLAFSFVIGKIHCNWAKRAACPATLCNRSGLSANWNAFNFWVTRDTPVFPISCPSHVTKQQYGDCGNNRISHCSEKKEQRSPMKLNHVSQREANLRYLGWVGLALRVGVGWEWVRYNHLWKNSSIGGIMWTFHVDLNEVMVRKGGKMQLSTALFNAHFLSWIAWMKLVRKASVTVSSEILLI